MKKSWKNYVTLEEGDVGNCDKKEEDIKKLDFLQTKPYVHL